MYRKFAVNTSLVFVLAFLFAVPFFGFGFATYVEEENTQSSVLGVNSFSQFNKAEATLEVIDQIDMEVNLNSKDKVQVIYNVVPEKYQGLEYKKYFVLPKDASLGGVTLSEQVGKDGVSTNFVFTLADIEEPLLNFPVTILIYRL